MSIEIISTGESSLLLPQINHQLIKLVKPEWFEIDFWQQQNAVTGQSKGRHITWFIGNQDDEWVLRHYYRGGFMAKLTKDKFWFRSLEQTRSYQELSLLSQMFQQGLPVPKPIVGQVIRSGFFYRSDIIIEKIPHTKTVAQYLNSSAMPEALWHILGGMIAKFHQAGIFHSDLNIHNILINQQEDFWLIDFDKCESRSVKRSWQQANLARLKRSFVKEVQLGRINHFAQQQWQWLLYGYRQFQHKK
ncbi:3-deoxy-D-manno-octulosonic acid kinase [Aliikangiella maris]|uniref:3-deoxy-D-manno-octulosonic acid kinase n=2 Tax=Aliikangiella maris TaxID=3162458 RepID=A0ABV2BSA3_9GAMM